MVALVIWALPFSGIHCSRAEVQSPGSRDGEQVTGEPITLTKDRPVDYFPIAPKALVSGPSILEVTVAKVVNPDKIPLELFVYLSAVQKKGEPKSESIPVGNFSLYPPDRPGKFLLSLSEGLEKLKTRAAAKSNELQLIVEMRRLNDTQPWTRVAVTVNPPRFLQDEPK